MAEAGNKGNQNNTTEKDLLLSSRNIKLSGGQKAIRDGSNNNNKKKTHSSHYQNKEYRVKYTITITKGIQAANQPSNLRTFRRLPGLKERK